MKTKNKISKLVATAAITVAAIAPSMAQNNLGQSCGCPLVSARTTTVLLSTLTNTVAGPTNGQLLADAVLTCDKMYILDDKVYVGDGQSLTINPGVVIKGRFVAAGSNANALIVSKGGKIFANGTESCQIVFTAEEDPMNGSYGLINKGKWGGIVVLGKAKNNLKVGNTLSASGVDGVGFIEGYVAAEPLNQFGMPVGSENDNDNSGIMTYVSIRHAGAIVGVNNELNGLTLGSVGRGTTLHHIEVISNLDDGIEFFGGTVDLKYGSVMFNDDDGFDWDLGWTGRGQFWSVVKTDQTTAAGGDNGFEADGDDNKTFNNTFLSNPTIYNATFVGSNNINGVVTTKGRGIEGKEETKGIIRNSILANYQTGFNLANDAAARTSAKDAYQNWLAGSFIVECNTFVGNTNLFRVNNVNVAAGSADEIKFLTTDKNVSAPSIAGFDFLHTVNVNTNVFSDKYDLVPTANLATTCPAAPADGFFTPANYRGAFESNKKSWLSAWSIGAYWNGTQGLVPCPTDINGDGVSNAADVSAILGVYGTSCQ